MLTKVYNNVVGHRVIDNNRVAEDVTSITLPTIQNTTSEIDAAGMIMKVDMPDTTHLEAMEFTVAHNNGVNCKYLADPGKHAIEVRVARQRYNAQGAEIEHESVKFRLTGIHKETDKGNIETGNPYGSSDKYSVIRYEEEIDGEIVTLIDAMNGIIKINGRDYSSQIDSLLS